MTDYADRSWLTRPEWADLSPTHEAPRRRTTDREPEFGPAALSHTDRVVLWVSFVASGIATGVSLFFVLTGGAS